jgi:hypothetical protein
MKKKMLHENQTPGITLQKCPLSATTFWTQTSQ